jgi:endonuclease III
MIKGKQPHSLAALTKIPDKTPLSSTLVPCSVLSIFERFQALNPSPQTELAYHNAYTLLVAVVLSAQATDKGVNKATATLFRMVDTPEAMLELGEERLVQHIKTIGLYRAKARHIMALSEKLVEHHHSSVPDNRDELQALPGVGRKTANVVLNVAFNQPTMAVDTHIFRVCNRTGLAPGKTVLDVEKALEKNVPQPFRLHAHHWLILHGRYICKARKPDCAVCPIVDLCLYPSKNL